MESGSLNKDKGNLTEEELQTLEKMQGLLMTIFNSAYRHKAWHENHDQLCVTSACRSYALITDILSRNRKAPNP